MLRRLAVWIVLGLVAGLILGCDSSTETEGLAESSTETASGSTAAEDVSSESAPASESPGESASAPTSPYMLPAYLQTQNVDAFLNQASGFLVVRSPEIVTHLGLGDALGLGNGELTPLSLAYEQETQAMEAAVLERLSTYDLDRISETSRLNARVYGWFLEDLVAGHRFSDHVYAINPYITSYPSSLLRFLTDTHPIRHEQDAVDYLHRLAQVAARYDELVVALRRGEAVGAIPPRFVVEQSLEPIRSMAQVAPHESPLRVRFAEKLAALSDLGEERRTEFLMQAEELLEESILPATERLLAYVEGLVERSPEEGGVWQHVDGEAYYNQRLRSYTTTDLTADEIHDIGLSEVDRIRQEILDAAALLGYGADLSIPEIYSRIEEDAGSLTGEATAAFCEGLLDEIEALVEPAFGRTPVADLVVASGSVNAFYSPGSLDGSRPGRFYAPTEVSTPAYELPTLTYHEAIPGHHFQISLAHEINIPGYRAGTSFTAYSEGWGLYAERLAWELGAYDEDPYGNLGRLQGEIFRAVRLVVDTGIHAKRWTYEEAVDYMIENTGRDEDFVRREIVRYTILPGQATSYKIGMLRILELRDRAMARLGDGFDLADFHDAVLLEGSVPLAILEELVDTYIAEAMGDG